MNLSPAAEPWNLTCMQRYSLPFPFSPTISRHSRDGYVVLDPRGQVGNGVRQRRRIFSPAVDSIRPLDFERLLPCGCGPVERHRPCREVSHLEICDRFWFWLKKGGNPEISGVRFEVRCPTKRR